MSAMEIDVKRGDRHLSGFQRWPTRKHAVADLRALRARGLNAEDSIVLYRAIGLGLWPRFWVIGRPDNASEFTWLMREDGSWAVGRLFDRHTDPAEWVWMPELPQPVPATFTHVTRTVPHAGTQTERYKTKSNGSCGRWVRSDDSVAICTCGWKSYTATRAEAQAAARWHRTQHPGPDPRPDWLTSTLEENASSLAQERRWREMFAQIDAR